MSTKLLSMLQNAMLEQYVRGLTPPIGSALELERNSPAFSTQLRYISNFLLEDDEVDCPQFVCEESYKKLFGELSNIISYPPSSPVDPRSFHLAAGGPRVMRPMLMDCAQALARNDIPLMVQTINAIRQGSSSSLHDLVAKCFVDALIARLTGTVNFQQDVPRSTGLPQEFANYTILERCGGAKRVHIVDYGIDHGQQWPSLIMAFSKRREGSPQITITGIDHPLYVRRDVGKRLLECARHYKVDLVVECITTDAWETPNPIVWRTKDEVVIVQCLIKSCYIKEDGTSGNKPRTLWLEKIRKMKPSLFIQSENAVTIGGPFFLQRFKATLNNIFVDDMYSYCASLHGTSEDVEKVARPYVMNYLCCDEGHLIRPMSYKEWGVMVRRAGFQQVPPTESVVGVTKQLAQQVNLKVRKVDEWLVLGFKNIENYAVCAWKPI